MHHELQNPAYSLQTRRQAPQPHGLGDGRSKQRTADAKANDFQQLGGTTKVVPSHKCRAQVLQRRSPRRRGPVLEISESM